MAMSFRNCLGSFALIAALILWASCSDVDKIADKTSKQEHIKIELSVDSKKETHEIYYDPDLLLTTQFDTNGVLIKVFKAYSIESAFGYNDDLEKIAQILRKETKPIYEIFDSFYKKETCYELYVIYLTLNVSIGTNGVVENVRLSSFLYADLNFIKRITEYVKQIQFQGVGKNDVSLSISFCEPMKDEDFFKHEEGAFVIHDFREVPLKKSIKRKPNGAVSAPTSDELKLADDVEHDKDSVLKVIRQRIPGLRHIYNKHLMVNHRKAYLKNNQDKVNPNFNGTIVFQLNINADGSVQKIEIQSSNTGNKDFDDEVKRALNRWKFSKMNSSVVATFPITFFENSTPYRIPN